MASRLTEAEGWRIAKEEAALAGFQFAKGCQFDFQKLLAKREGEPLAMNPSFAPFDEEPNIRKLVQQMVQKAQAEGWTELREETLRAALRELCPIWPFCRTKYNG
jgi:hypothetical protein